MRDYVQEAVEILWPQIDFPSDRIYEWPLACAEAYHKNGGFEQGRVAARKELARFIVTHLQNAGIVKDGDDHES